MNARTNRNNRFPRFHNVIWITLAPLALALVGCGGGGVENHESHPADEIFDPTKVSVPEPTEAREVIPLTETIGSDRRKAVMFEAYYALRQGWLNPPNESGPFGGNQINGCVVGDWGYLNSDVGAFNHVVSRITRKNASVSNENMLTWNYMMKASKERTGQCLFFTVLLLRRALSYDLPVAWSKYPASAPSARNAQPGDVVYYKHAGGSNHIGVCVLKTSAGIDVVDANFVGYGTYRIRPGYSSSEVIGRHWLSNATINANGWKLYSGKGRWY